MSYASEIEHRAIFNNWNSYSRAVGRIRIRGISERQEGSAWYGNRIGTEVCWKNASGSGNNYNNTEQNGSDWILRFYVDGTAYFYPDQLQSLNYPTRSSILEMVRKHYRVVKEMEQDSPSWYTRKFQILRRKPVGQLSMLHFVKSLEFGDFLKNKYNDVKGEDDNA